MFDPLLLVPSQTLYVTPGTAVNYYVSFFNEYQSKGNAMTSREVFFLQYAAIPMPNPQYAWSAANDTVATVSNTGRALAKKVGRSNIVVYATGILYIYCNPNNIIFYNVYT